MRRAEKHVGPAKVIRNPSGRTTGITVADRSQEFDQPGEQHLPRRRKDRVPGDLGEAFSPTARTWTAAPNQQGPNEETAAQSGKAVSLAAWDPAYFTVRRF